MQSKARITLAALAVSAVLLSACSEENDYLELDKVLSGNVSNDSGVSGTVIVEIEHNLRDTADSGGNWAISVHSDYYVDSLYAWVDVDGDKTYDVGEPYGNYDNAGFRVRTDVSNLNFSIP